MLVCDEIGYLPMRCSRGQFFYQVISGRHERKSTIITTNMPFAEWGRIFGNLFIATAIADRLVCIEID